jgi:hypothetical protein
MEPTENILLRQSHSQLSYLEVSNVSLKLSKDTCDPNYSNSMWQFLRIRIVVGVRKKALARAHSNPRKQRFSGTGQINSATLNKSLENCKRQIYLFRSSVAARTPQLRRQANCATWYPVRTYVRDPLSQGAVATCSICHIPWFGSRVQVRPHVLR